MSAAKAFLQTATDTANATTYTFSSQNLGTASSDRYILVGIGSRAAGTTEATINSVTVGGVSATIPVQRSVRPVNLSIAGFAIAAVPTGTTGDIVITFSREMLRCGIVAYAITGNNASASDTDSGASADPSVNLDIPADGVAFGMAVTARTATGGSWSGLTSDFDFVVEGNTQMSSASDAFATLQTGLSIQRAFPTNSESVGAFASWGPAVGGGAIPVFINHYRQQGIM
jgi:hypothetical protein